MFSYVERLKTLRATTSATEYEYTSRHTNVRLGEDTNENARWRIHSVGSAFVTVRRYQYHYKRLNLPIFGGGRAQAGSPKNPPLVMSHD